MNFASPGNLNCYCPKHFCLFITNDVSIFINQKCNLMFMFVSNSFTEFALLGEYIITPAGYFWSK